MEFRRAAWLFGLFLLASSVLLGTGLAEVQAHQTAASHLVAHVKPDVQEVDLLITVASNDLAHYEGIIGEGDELAAHQIEPELDRLVALLSKNVTLRNNGVECAAVEELLVPGAPVVDRLSLLKSVRCEQALGEVEISNRIMLDATGGYRHFGRVQIGDEIHATVFDRQFPTFTLVVASAAGSGESAGESLATVSTLDTFVRYLWQGVLHIVIGFDHVLFVLCLLLAARRLRRLLVIVTSFTIAHSVTLGLSALNIFTLPEGLIEPLIALSIAYVAAENILRKGEVPYLYATTFVFGLVHGFGFSYVLRDELGLPTEALIPALFSFNLGVELGQLAIVLLMFPLLTWMAKKTWYEQVVRWASAAILVMAMYWLVVRIVF